MAFWQNWTSGGNNNSSDNNTGGNNTGGNNNTGNNTGGNNTGGNNTGGNNTGGNNTGGNNTGGNNTGGNNTGGNNVNPRLGGMYSNLTNYSLSEEIDLHWSTVYLESYDESGAYTPLYNTTVNVRGVNPVNWALKNNETSHGVTLHHISEGVDSGDIIDQEFFNINNGFFILEIK